MLVEDVLSLLVLKTSKLTLLLVAMRLCRVQMQNVVRRLTSKIIKVFHETEVCEYRRVKCHDCGQIQEDVETLKKSLLELDEKVEATNKKMKNNHVEMKEVVRNLQDQIKQDQQVQKNVKDVHESLSKVNKDVDEVKVMMIQVLEKLNMLEQHNKVSSPTAGILNTPKEDVLVAGGWGNAGRSTEIYSWEKNGWFEVSQMNKEHFILIMISYLLLGDFVVRQ